MTGQPWFCEEQKLGALMQFEQMRGLKSTVKVHIPLTFHPACTGIPPFLGRKRSAVRRRSSLLVSQTVDL